MLYQNSSDYLKEGHLKPLLGGERVIAQAFTEPTVGTDLARLKTTARKEVTSAEIFEAAC